MKVIHRNDLLGKTIKVISYNRRKSRVIFVLDDSHEVMIRSPLYNRYGKTISEHNLFYKNRYKIDYREIHDIYIKDIGYDGTSVGISYLLIIDEKGDTYRTHCYVSEFGTVNTNFYDYSLHKQQKKEKEEKKQKRLNKIKSIFVNNNYDKI